MPRNICLNLIHPKQPDQPSGERVFWRTSLQPTIACSMTLYSKYTVYVSRKEE